MEPFADPAPLPRPPDDTHPGSVAVGPYPPVAPSPPQRPPVAGQLTPRWTQAFWIGWLLVAASFVAVWYSSRLVGLSTWWLGPETEPRFILLNLLPFVAPLALVAAALGGARLLPVWGILAALATAGIAAFDIDRVPGYAAVEFTVAAGSLLLSVASFAGMYRPATPARPD